MELISEAVQNFAVSLIELVLILNPPIVVIGGDICELLHVEELFLEPLARYVGEVLPFEPPEIKKTALGKEAGILGASLPAIESFLDAEFPASWRRRSS
jgi:predicted NBD/HSP70 family sugar kinase